MKQYSIILMLLTFFMNEGFAQQDSLPAKKKSRWKIFIAVGTAIPIGKFTTFEEIPQNNQYGQFNMAGPAQISISGRAGCRYLVGRHLGVGASFYFSTFGSEKLSGEEIFDHADFGNENWQWDGGKVSESGKWQAKGLLIGISYEISKSKIGYGINLKGGLQMARSPQVSLTTVSPEINFFTGQHDKAIRDQPVMNSNALAYQAGGFLSYHIGRKTSLSLTADYTSASHQFKGDLEVVQYTDAFLAPWTFRSTTPVSFKKQVSFLSVMLGFNYDF